VRSASIEPIAPAIRATYITYITADKGSTMQIPTCLHAGVAATGIAFVGIGAMTAASVAPVTQSQAPPTVAQDVRLAAATVPPGGLVTSFLGNQLVYCSLICPLLVQTAATPIVTTLQTPGTFLTALQSGNLLKAIGVTAASVTGPTNAAAEQAILVDGSIPAPRALNAFEVAVVGLLNVIPAAAGGLPGIAAAIQTARQDTFDALNLPVVPNQPSTVMPRGVVQVVVVSALNVVGAIIFPGFNHILSGAFQVPDAVAQELAATGDPVRAVAAGVNAATAAVTAAGAVIADSVATAVSDIRAATGQALPANRTVPTQNSATTTTPARTELGPPRALAATTAKHDEAEPGTPHSLVTTPTKKDDVESDTSHPSATTTAKHDDTEGDTSHPSATTTAKHDDAKPGTSHTLRDVASSVRQTVKSVVKKAAEQPHHAASG
jgi:hypothetical protein